MKVRNRAPAATTAACLVGVMLLTGCSDRRVPIRYRFDPGEQNSYTWVIEATRRLETPNELKATRLRSEIDVRETIRGPSRSGRQKLSLRLSTRSLREDGVALPLPRPRTVEFEIDPQGRVSAVTAPEGARDPAPHLGTLVTEMRPPLSESPVAIGETWSAGLKVREGTGEMNLRGTGRLKGYDFLDRRRVALVETVQRGSIKSNETIEGAAVSLSGRTRITGHAAVDVDGGGLVFSNHRSRSHFDLITSGRVGGNLDVTLTSRVRLKNS